MNIFHFSEILFIHEEYNNEMISINSIFAIIWNQLLPFIR